MTYPRSFGQQVAAKRGLPDDLEAKVNNLDPVRHACEAALAACERVFRDPHIYEAIESQETAGLIEDALSALERVRHGHS